MTGKEFKESVSRIPDDATIIMPNGMSEDDVDGYTLYSQVQQIAPHSRYPNVFMVLPNGSPVRDYDIEQLVAKRKR